MSSKKNLVVVAVIIIMSYTFLNAFTGHEKMNEVSPLRTAVDEKPADPVSVDAETPVEIPSAKSEGCVFKTVFGEENVDSDFVVKTPAKVSFAIDEALEWMAKAQLNDGGFGAGSHSHQDITNPRAVKADPATTAMVSMALLRSGSTLSNGPFATNLKRALEYLLVQVEESGDNEFNITSLTGTQPQTKLGQNIDVVLTSQFFTNLMDCLQNNGSLKQRVVKCNNKCLVKIQKSMAENGSVRGAGWAGVLQSSFATNALETAQDKGLNVDKEKLEQAKRGLKHTCPTGATYTAVYRH